MNKTPDDEFTSCIHLLYKLACNYEGPVCSVGTVDKYIDVHSRDHKLTNSGKATPQAEVGCTQRACIFRMVGRLASWLRAGPSIASC